MNNTNNKEQKSYIFYKIMVAGIMAELICIFLKVTNVFTMNWLAITLVPILITYIAIAALVLTLVIRQKIIDSKSRKTENILQ